jgi:hypothetical protein
VFTLSDIGSDIDQCPRAVVASSAHSNCQMVLQMHDALEGPFNNHKANSEKDHASTNNSSHNSCNLLWGLDAATNGPMHVLSYNAA